jgi:hypothetical protein
LYGAKYFIPEAPSTEFMVGFISGDTQKLSLDLMKRQITPSVYDAINSIVGHRKIYDILAK